LIPECSDLLVSSYQNQCENDDELKYLFTKNRSALCMYINDRIIADFVFRFACLFMCDGKNLTSMRKLYPEAVNLVNPSSTKSDTFLFSVCKRL